MNIGCLLSAREKSKRLPKKVILDLDGDPLILRLLKRLSLAQNIDKVILSTSVNEDDKVLVEIAKNNGYEYFCGSEDDKLDRYFQTAKKFDLDGVVIVDGDDLFCFPEYIDIVAKYLRSNQYDCIYIDGLPVGAASTGLTKTALKKVLEIKDEQDTEVWGGYFINSGRFNSKKIIVSDQLFNKPDLRLTIDYEEDFLFAKAQ